MKAKYFSIEELVCPHVLEKYGEKAWMFLDDRLIYNLDTIRERIGKPIFVNIGDLSQRGLRCNQCQIVKDKAGELYLSAHIMGKAVDFNVRDIEAEVMRLWLAKNGHLLPYPIRLESGVSWIHMDIFPNELGLKVFIFKP